MGVQPLAEHGVFNKDPFASNQAISTLLCRREGGGNWSGFSHAEDGALRAPG